MGLKIEDGHGSGTMVKVGPRGHMQVLALDLPIAAFFATEGESYYMPTDFISYTTVSPAEHLLAYVKNLRGARWHITNMRVSVAPQVGTPHSDEDVRVRLYKNPDSVAGGTIVLPVNTNFESGQNFQGEFQKGADGATVTGGELAASIGVINGTVDVPTDDALILGNGNSMALTVEASAAHIVGCTLWGHYFD
jgi:hypothetical protein